MPTSTAATTMLRLFAGVEPGELDRHAQRRCSGRIRLGSCISTASVRAFRSTENHCRPIARPGMRLAASSSGRRRVATT